MAVEPSAAEIDKNLDNSAREIGAFARHQNPNLTPEDVKSISDSAKEYMQTAMKDMDASHSTFGALAMAFHAKADPAPYNQAKELGVTFDKSGKLLDIEAVKPQDQEKITKLIADGLGLPAKNAEDLVKPDATTGQRYTAATVAMAVPPAP